MRIAPEKLESSLTSLLQAPEHFSVLGMTDTRPHRDSPGINAAWIAGGDMRDICSVLDSIPIFVQVIYAAREFWKKE